MSDDELFRWILVAGLAVTLPFSAYFRHRSHTGEPLDRWQEGWYILFPLRILGIASMAGVLAYAINPRWMSWSSWPLPVWLRWLGVVLGALAAGLIFWTFRHLGPNLTDTVVTRKEHTLVTSGPYQYVRHPFYVAFILAVVANALTTANWFLLLTGAAAWLFVVLRTPREEAKLVERFGQAYRDYRDQTGMLFPHLSRRRKAHD